MYASTARIFFLQCIQSCSQCKCSADVLSNGGNQVQVATKTMALEYAPTIRFNCIAPAVGNTSMYVFFSFFFFLFFCFLGFWNPITETSWWLLNGRLQASIGNGVNSQERLQKIEESLPMRRLTEPADIANAAWYLGSDESSFVTGTVLEVDGGRAV